MVNNTMFSSHMSYHLWATQEMLLAVRSVDAEAKEQNLGTSFGSLRGTLDHMFAADRVWIDRLNRKVVSTLQAVVLSTEIDALAVEWTTMLGREALQVCGFTSDEFGAIREFVNSQGTTYTMPVWQILLHMVNHGTGHRGQVTSMLRQLGVTPRGTDLVQFYRAHPPTPARI